MDKEGLKKEIEYFKDLIEFEKSINEHSGELSFLYYQLHWAENKLKELEEKKND